MPVLVDGAALLAALFACIVCYMLLVAYQSTLGALLRVIANAINIKLPLIGYAFAFIANGILALDSKINAALVDAVDGTRWAFARVLNFTALLIHQAMAGVADLAEATYGAVSHTVEHVIPELVAGTVKPVWGAVHSLSHQLAYLWRVVSSVAQSVDRAASVTVPKVISKTVTVTRVEVEKQTKTVVQAVAGTLPRVGSIERTLHGIDATLKDTLRKVSPAALAGVFIGSVLSLTGLTWLRCGNVGRTGRALCGLNANVLEGLLAGLLSIFGTIGIVTFAKDVQKVVGDFGSEIGRFWRADVIGTGGDRALGSPGLQ